MILFRLEEEPSNSMNTGLSTAKYSTDTDYTVSDLYIGTLKYI